MLKKLITTAIVGGAMLGMVSSANAETNINIYGASAQYTFWNSAAADFLTTYCTGTIETATDSSGKNGITRCTDDGTGEPIYIRYSSKASYDGIRSVQGLDPDGVAAADGCAANERMMADESVITSWGDGGVTALVCKDVTIGASDVAAETFQQESHGDLLGPAGGGAEDREIFNITMDPSYSVYRPVVVPFAFFRNANPSTPVPYDNMSRLMATSIFNGQVANWNQFDPTADSVQVTVCMRHAGSGTHATLDAAVMRGDYSLLINQKDATDALVMLGLAPYVYFNDGSSDEMRCVGGGTIAGYDGIGAVGYADADKVVMDPATGEYHNAAKYGDVKTMTWNGEEPIKSNIVNGKYDFWSAQWLYASPADSGTTGIGPMVNALAAFAEDAANLPLDKAAYWSSQGEMKVDKATDFTFPKFK